MPPTQSKTRTTALFLHGLDSSIQGTKGQWFRQHFPAVRMHDYHGDLDQRLAQLAAEAAGLDDLILVGSSFGGLMATCFALRHPRQVGRLILLAPALNFSGYRPPATSIPIPTLLVIGARDTVCPPDLVLPQARATFRTLEERLVDDDHMLHHTFPSLDWLQLLT